jgi:hypothetical protein
MQLLSARWQSADQYGGREAPAGWRGSLTAGASQEKTRWQHKVAGTPLIPT